MISPRLLAIIAAFAASFIYGVNHTIAKGLMPSVISPYGFILLRVGGAGVIFWVLGLFYKKETIQTKDWMRIIACAFFGMVLNMTMFFKGLSLSTPINSSVVITVAPVLLLVLSGVFLKERITLIKGVGIALGLAGALALILFGEKTQPNAPNIPLGNMLFLVNAASYSTYLIIVKPLTAKYGAITLMKFFFLFAVIINIPIGYQEFVSVNWLNLEYETIGQLAFVVIGTTVLTYLFNIYALKQLSPSVLGVFMYLQPLIATLFAVLMGSDTLTEIRVVAATLIFLGVYLVTRKKPKNQTSKL